MMKKLSKMLFLSLACIVLVLAAVIGCSNTEEEPEKPVPNLVVSSDTVSGKVRTAIALPTATAQDEIDGDISSSVRIKIMFKDDDMYVLPKTNVNEGVALSENPSYTPTKVGTYEITYFVTNSSDEQATKAVTMTVTENTEDTLGQNLVGKNKLGDWIVGQDDQNGVANEYGEIVLAEKGSNFTGAVYKGRKIKNGDTVSFSFRAEPVTEVMFYNIAFLLTPNSDKDAPASNEGDWPEYYNIRISSTSIQSFLVSSNNVNFDMFDQMGVNLCDGETHTISLNIDAGTDSVTSKIWVDKDTDTSPSQTTVKRKSDVQLMYGEDTEHVKIFDPNITGWLSFSAYVLGDTSHDSFTLRSLTINNESMIQQPELEVAEFPLMIVGQEITMPEYSAKDMNDYSNIKDRVEISVKVPGSETFTALNDSDTYKPETVGQYVFKYVVTDRSGNTEYQTFNVDCSKGASTEKPVISFDSSVKDSYEVAVNSEFAIPVPTSVTDSFGDDISARLRIALVGREKAELNGQASYTFRATGTNILRYEVADYNNNITTKDIEINVVGSAAGNILEDTDNFYLGTGMTITDGNLNIKGGANSFAYGKQKIYDQKVSILINMGLASSAGGTDGSNIILLNLRGGKQLTKVPQTPNNPDGVTDFNWPNGLSLLITTHWGITLKPSGYEGSDYANANLGKTMQEIFNGKDVVLSFQLTDEYDEDGTFVGVRFRLWIDDEEIDFVGGYATEDGSVLLTQRVINTNENIMQAGWLSMYFNDGVESNIRSITIDGSKPVYKQVSLDKEADQTFEVGQTYTLPVCTLKIDGEDLSSQVKKFIWIDGQIQPDISGAGYAEATIVPTAEHAKGFTVLYVYNGEIIRSVHVANENLGSKIIFEQDEYTAVIGQEFNLPEFTATYDGSDVTSDVVVKIVVGYMEKELIENVYLPTVAEDFVLNYYLYNNLIASKTVSVSGGVAKDYDLAQDGVMTGGDAWLYAGQQIYNNKVAVTFSLEGAFKPEGWVDFALRGNVQQTEGEWFSYQSGLVLRLEYNAKWGVFFKVGYGGNDGWFDTSYGESTIAGLEDLDWTQEHTVVYSIYDVYEEGKFVGIRFELWFDGQAVQFKNLAFPGMSDGSYILIPADNIQSISGSEDIFCPSYLFVWSKDQADSKIHVSEAYIMGVGDEYPAA